jgi:hypothetical protein
MSEQLAGSPVPTTTVALVEREARLLLSASPAYQGLPPDSQRQLTAGMVRIGAYLAEPGGITANCLPGAISAVPSRTAAQPAHDLLDAVNFPEFVAGLIRGVFQARHTPI